MIKVKSRGDATAFLRKRGVKLADTALAQLASDGRGPAYSILNGRAVYTEQALLDWVEQQLSNPVKRRRAAPAAAANAA